MRFFAGICFCLGIFWLVPEVQATHINGGDIEWEYLGNDSFKITVNVFRNCNGTILASQPLTITSSTCRRKNYKTSIIALGDITPVCDEQCTRCDSKGCTFKYGIQQWAISAIIDVSDFKKNGCCWLTASWAECCRDNQFTTGAGGTDFYLESKVNVCQATPFDIWWQAPPASVICLGRDHVSSNNRLISSSVGDSIVHSLTEPLQGDTIKTPWRSPYSYDHPIYYLGFPVANRALPQGFRLDSTTATMRFRPMREEQTLITVKAQVYRNGQLLAETVREHPVIVIKCPSNSPPVVSGINCKSNQDKDFYKSICQGEKLEFDVCVSDQDKDDTVSIHYSHNIPNAQVSIKNKGSKRPSLHFEWTSDTLDTLDRVYSLFVEATDDACPVNGRRGRIFLIRVNKSSKLSVDTIPQSCGNYVFVAKADSFESFEWTINNKVITHTPIGKSNIDSLRYRFEGPGSHTVLAKAYTNGWCSHLSRSTLQVANDFLWIKPTRPDTLRPCSGQTFKVGVKTFGTSITPTTTWNQIDSNKGFQSSRTFRAGPRNGWINFRVSDGSCTRRDSFFVRTELEYVKLPENLIGCSANDTFVLNPFSHPSQAYDSITSFKWRPMFHRDSTLQITKASVVFIELTDTNGCLHKDTSTLSYKSGKFFIPNDTLVCGPGNARFTARAPTKGRFDWFFKGDKIRVKDSANTTVFLNQAQEVVVTFTDTLKSKECVYSDNFFLGFRYPAFSQLFYPDTICAGDSFEIKTRLPQALWTFQDSTAIGSTTKLRAEPSQPGGRNYPLKMEGISKHGCAKDTQVLVFVNSVPKVKFTAPDSTFQNWKVSPQNLSTNSKLHKYEWEVGTPPFVLSNAYSPTLRIDSIGVFDLKLRVTHKWNGCGDSSLKSIKVLRRVGFSSHAVERPYQLYPNPVAQTMYVQWPNVHSYQLRIYSTSGQLKEAYHASNELTTLDVSQLPPGIYLVHLQSNTHSVKGTFEIVR